MILFIFLLFSRILNLLIQKVADTESWRNSHVELSPEKNRLLSNSPAPSVRNEQMGNKSRAYYQMKATRSLTAQKPFDRPGSEFLEQPVPVTEPENLDPSVTRVLFKHRDYRVLENCGEVIVTVIRKGPEMDRLCYVDYTTIDGTAKAGSDYERTNGTITFQVVRHKVYEFYKKLFNKFCEYTELKFLPATQGILALATDH